MINNDDVILVMEGVIWLVDFFAAKAWFWLNLQPSVRIWVTNQKEADKGGGRAETQATNECIPSVCSEEQADPYTGLPWEGQSVNQPS